MLHGRRRSRRRWARCRRQHLLIPWWLAHAPPSIASDRPLQLDLGRRSLLAPFGSARATLHTSPRRSGGHAGGGSCVPAAEGGIAPGGGPARSRHGPGGPAPVSQVPSAPIGCTDDLGTAAGEPDQGAGRMPAAVPLRRAAAAAAGGTNLRRPLPARRRHFSDPASFPYEPKDLLDISVARSRGVDVLHDPVGSGMGGLVRVHEGMGRSRSRLVMQGMHLTCTPAPHAHALMLQVHVNANA